MVSKAILSLDRKYKNQSDVRIGRDFIQPCLRECTKYRRGTGTFSSSAFKSYINAIDHFIDEDIKIEILCSPKIDFPLYETLKNCHSDKDRDDIIQELTNNIAKIAAGFKDNPKDQDYRSLLIAYLITNKKLEIKIAQPLNYKAIRVYESSAIDDEDPDMNDVNTRAMYHIKYGYFEFKDNIKVAFEGSVNETDTAFNMNSEKATVFRSWEPKDIERMEDIINDLDIDWNGKNNDIKLYEIDDETLKVISEHVQKYTGGKRPKSPTPPLLTATPHKIPKIDLDKVDETKSKIVLRDYQKEALKEWKNKDYKGILAMATGSGKTLTAIHAFLEFKEKYRAGFAFIVVPKQDLARQWIDEFSKNNIKAIHAFENKKNWIEELRNSCMEATGKKTNAPCVIAVVNTFISKSFRGLLDLFHHVKEKNHMLIADECHHFNDEEQIKRLPEFINWRLGLSATPYDQYEKDKNKQFLNNYFGEIVYKYSLSRAIKEKRLTGYKYHVIEINLNEEETLEYIKLSKKIAAASGYANTESRDALIGQRARLISDAEEKLIKLKNIAEEKKEKFTLVYCGDATDGEEKPIKQINKVTKIFNDAGWNTSQITFTEGSAERSRIIENFEKASIDILASIRILDEGIDLPCCRKAYLLSSRRSSREHIQRRGRVLRKFMGKDFAEIYDFVITSTTENKPSTKNLIKNELERVFRFAKDSMTKDEVTDKYKKLADHVGLDFDELETEDE